MDTVWVVEQGNYSARYVVGVFTSLEKVLEVFGKYGTWHERGPGYEWMPPGMWNNQDGTIPYNHDLDATPLKLDTVIDEWNQRQLVADDLHQRA